MKRAPRKSNAPSPKQPRTVDEQALSEASGGTDAPPALPWVPDQHNEAFVHARRRRRRTRR